MRGELDNVTVAESHILLDVVQGGYVPYGCYTSAPIPMPAFDALRPSWNAYTPPGTAVEVQARVMVDGNWTAWSGFGRWSPFLRREGAFFSASFLSSSNPPVSVRTNLSTSSYSLELSPPLPEMMSGVRASSMRMESASSTMA